MNFWKVADLWHTLMTEILGYPKYAAGGCNVGALVTGQLGHKYADELYGIHIGSALKLDLFNGDRAWDLSGGRPIPEGIPDDVRARILTFDRRFAVHLAAHVLDSSTLAYGLTDSPTGMLAWILERWVNWSDNHGNVENVFTKDDILTHATIYWVTNAIGTSMRTYANNNRYPWTPSHDRQPVIDCHLPESPSSATRTRPVSPPTSGSRPSSVATAPPGTTTPISPPTKLAATSYPGKSLTNGSTTYGVPSAVADSESYPDRTHVLRCLTLATQTAALDSIRACQAGPGQVRCGLVGVKRSYLHAGRPSDVVSSRVQCRWAATGTAVTADGSRPSPVITMSRSTSLGHAGRPVCVTSRWAHDARLSRRHSSSRPVTLSNSHELLNGPVDSRFSSDERRRDTTIPACRRTG